MEEKKVNELKQKDEEFVSLDAQQGANETVPLEDGSDAADENGLKKQGTEDGSTTVDYAAELERLKAERDNYKKGMLNTKRELKEVKQQETVADKFDPAELERLIFEKLEEREQRINAEREREIVSDELRNVAETSGEMDLIRYHYDNTIRHSGYTRKAIADDMRRAKLLANSSRVSSENEELKKSLISKETRGDKPQFSGTKRAVKREATIKVTAREKKLLERYGAVDRYKKTVNK